jgi:Pyruvate/2-oxoacid:ferredoxin oxidoreductase delta subunit
MKDRYIEAKAIRKYDFVLIEKKSITRCDVCKRFEQDPIYEMVPEQSMHNFDNLFVCGACIDKCGFEITEAGFNELKRQ